MNEQEKFERKDELDAFIVEENEPADKKLLASVIAPYVTSMGKNQIVDYTEEYEHLDTWKKILVYLCCRKVMHIKGILTEEGTGPKEISERANIGLDSAKDISRNSNLKGIVTNFKGKYLVPNYRLKRLKGLLQGDGNSNG